MSDPVITTCPTLSNPEAIETVDELRAELHRTNQSLLELTDRLNSHRTVLQEISQTLSNLVFAYLRGDGAKVADLLAEVVKNHVRVAAPSSSTH